MYWCSYHLAAFVFRLASWVIHYIHAPSSALPLFRVSFHFIDKIAAKMSTIPQEYAQNGTNGTSSYDHAGANGAQVRKPYDYGGNPLAHINTGDSVRLAAFGGELQPGLYRSTEKRKFANPAPLGLCGFALTTFLLSCINLGTRGLSEPNIVIGAAFAYGGLVQLLAGMWYVYSSGSISDPQRFLMRLSGRWPLATPSVLPLFLLTVVSGSVPPSFSPQVDSRSSLPLRPTPLRHS